MPSLALRVLNVALADHGCDWLSHATGPERRTVLAAGPAGTLTSLAHILYMIAEQTPMVDEEPMGIVISCGPEGEEAPAVFEYIWGPAPESTEDGLESKVA
jgi:hypothetical protein